MLHSLLSLLSLFFYLFSPLQNQNIMQTAPIETLLFDLGGVLIDWNPRYLFRKIFDTEEEIDFFLEHICTSDWNEEQDGGRSLLEGTTSLLLEHPKFTDPIRAFYSRWSEMLGGPIQGTLDLLGEVREEKKYRLYALTNWSAETFPIAQERYEFLTWFTDILVSGVEKLKKPDPAIYQLALDRFDLNPATTLFIDDNARNIAAAAAMGIQVHHFTDSAALRKLLGK